MSNKVFVEYTGKKIFVHLQMPWLKEDAPFDDSRCCDMDAEDAERLCVESPRAFRILERVEEGEASPGKVEDEGSDGQDEAARIRLKLEKLGCPAPKTVTRTETLRKYLEKAESQKG